MRLIQETAVEPPNTPMNADNTKHYINKLSTCLKKPVFFLASDFSACICVHRRLTAFWGLFFVFAGLLLWTTPVLAETYSWVDESGTYNFTEDYSRVPKKYRNKVGVRGDVGGAAVPQESVTSPIKPGVAAPKGSAAGKIKSPVENYGGKSFDQWQQELREREAAMLAVKNRISEMDVVLNKNNPDREQAQSLMAERNQLVGQFNDMRKEYDQYVEKARQAGIKVDIKQ